MAPPAYAGGCVRRRCRRLCRCPRPPRAPTCCAPTDRTRPCHAPGLGQDVSRSRRARPAPALRRHDPRRAWPRRVRAAGMHRHPTPSPRARLTPAPAIARAGPDPCASLPHPTPPMPLASLSPRRPFVRISRPL
eukprot:4074570-Prymnesium_polylepis.1